MTDWLPPKEMEKKILGDNPTIEDIKNLHAKFLEDGMFKAFMMLFPSDSPTVAS